jgi:hypothetical protein
VGGGGGGGGGGIGGGIDTALSQMLFYIPDLPYTKILFMKVN